MKTEAKRKDELILPLGYPDREGKWRCLKHDGDCYEFEVYKIPTGQLCAWGEDCERGDLNQSEIWDSDEWVGHIPVECLALDGDFFYLDNSEI